MKAISVSAVLSVMLLTEGSAVGQRELASGMAASSRELLLIDHRPVDAVQGIVAAFKKHPVVIIAEWKHGIRQMGDFYIRMVRDSDFQETVQDIVIEFASRNNQPLLDRYIAGENVPMAEVQHIWRDTTKVASWESPMYAEWLAAIREVNKKVAPERRFRVLAGDSAVDWNRIQTHAAWEALGDNNISFADVIVNEVIRKKRHALVVLGGNHVNKMGARTGDPNATTLVESRSPGSVYTVLHQLKPVSSVEAVLHLPDLQAAALYDLAGTPLGEKPDKNGVPPIRYTDALLYVGAPESLTESKPPD